MSQKGVPRNKLHSPELEVNTTNAERMKPDTMKLILLLAASLSAASAFVASPLPSFAACTAFRAAGAGKSDGETAQAWDELKQIERDLVVQQRAGDLDEGEASKTMAEKLLETALDYGEQRC